ncbi:DNA-binding transcriptional LysR family regulator [Rhizobium tibeticum]|uniref:LysR family transcriptional regulator n=1 Tax=Rhizobium tibeticum TaxID=501024 RepID=UPI00277EFB24|nr:LysR family transcriptional regulator [Rhizobium tibeticum]MDP9810182.1 DNA-binding transcriptional LysR family regulator [Rhizobium tibeticum]
MDQLKALKVFCRIIELGSFAAAARDLGLSPAMVGNHVRALEEWYGTPLLLRTTRQQNLTEEGREVAERATAILAEMTALEEVAKRGSDPEGHVRISAPVGIGRYFVAPIMRRLSLQYPKLRVELRLSDQPEDLVRSGVDLAIRNGPLVGGESLIARVVARRPLVLAAAPAYASTSGMPASLDDLRSHRTVRYCRDGRPRPWLFPTDEGLVQLDPPTGFMSDDIEALRDAAVDGVGITWLPDWLLASHFEDGSLVQVMPNQPAFSIETFLVRPHAALTKRVALLNDVLASQLKIGLGTSGGVRQS